MEHKLKTWPGPFQDIIDGVKTFEIRKDDREFMLGDTLLLEEYEPIKEKYTGRDIKCCVTYHMPGGIFGLHEDYCALGITTVKVKPTIEELEKILEDKGQSSVKIMPNGSIRVKE